MLFSTFHLSLSWSFKTKLRPTLILFFLLPSVFIFGQTERQISGTVTDQHGMQVPDVTVTIKGTANGTSTNLEGQYSIHSTPDQTLVFQSVGYESKEVLVNDQTIIN